MWTREHRGAALTVALFPELAAGDHRVLDAQGLPWRAVRIRGGELATVDLRS